MSKGATSKIVLNSLKMTKKIFTAFYEKKAVSNTGFRHMAANMISLCNYVILRKLGNTFVEMELSSVCNSRCIFCSYVKIAGSGKKLQQMAPETYEKVLEKLKLVNYETVSFTPTTGDTLINPDWDGYIRKALALDPLKTILLYTNGILMNKENIEKLIGLLKYDKQRKIFSLLFSLGGFDRETYTFMFGVDKFNQVKENIKTLLSRLQEEKMTLLVNLEFRIPNDYQLDLNKVKKELNTAGYPFLGARVLRKFAGIEGLEKSEKLCYNEETGEKKKFCSYLRKTRFAADGGVWADGCVVSELPGDTSLKLGTVDDEWHDLEYHRKRIVDEWIHHGRIPAPCRTCTLYRSDNKPFQEGLAIPLWEGIYAR